MLRTNQIREFCYSCDYFGCRRRRRRVILTNRHSAQAVADVMSETKVEDVPETELEDRKDSDEII